MQWLSPIKLPPTEPILQQSTAQIHHGKDPTADRNDENESIRQGWNQGSKVDRMIELGINPVHAIDQEEEELNNMLRLLKRQYEELSRQRENLTGLALDSRVIGSREDRGQGRRGAIVDTAPSRPHSGITNILNGSQVPLLHVHYRDTGRQTLARSLSSPARSHRCPLCRKPAFSRWPACCSDTLQLLRVRYRLTDLVYAFLSLRREKVEQQTRKQIITFLGRRYADTTALGEREITLSLSDCQLIFDHARFILYRQHRDHRKEHGLSKEKKSQLTQLISVLDYFIFKEAFKAFFFDPSPKYDTDIKLDLSTEDRNRLREDPEKLSKTLEKHLEKLVKLPEMEMKAEGRVAVSVRQDDDVEMMDVD
ncbi:MAG: hypothetical protein Q9188_002881 [Gyalolechia gomerana]